MNSIYKKIGSVVLFFLFWRTRIDDNFSSLISPLFLDVLCILRFLPDRSFTDSPNGESFEKKK